MARLGDLNLKKVDDDARPTDYAIVERIKHPLFKEPSFYHDIALLKLDKDVQFSEWVLPACLPDISVDMNPSEGIAIGWGLTDWSNYYITNT